MFSSDLKSDNILIRTDGHVRIIDFGYSRYVIEATRLPPQNVYFAAPEINEWKDAGIPSDLWAFGVVVVYLLQQILPFVSNNENKHGRKIEIREAAAKSEPNIEGISDPDARDFVLQLLKKDPNDRLKDVLNHPFLKDAPAEPSFFPTATQPETKEFGFKNTDDTPFCVDFLQEFYLRIPKLAYLAQLEEKAEAGKQPKVIEL